MKRMDKIISTELQTFGTSDRPLKNAERAEPNYSSFEGLTDDDHLLRWFRGLVAIALSHELPVVVVVALGLVGTQMNRDSAWQQIIVAILVFLVYVLEFFHCRSQTSKALDSREKSKKHFDGTTESQNDEGCT